MDKRKKDGDNTKKLKTIMVAGASGGIGKAVALKLSDDKTRIVLVGRRIDKLEAVRSSIKGEAIVKRCDVTDYQEVAELFEWLRLNEIMLSGMVYCAGIWCMKPLKIMEAGELDRLFKTNISGFYEMCRLFNSPKVSEKDSSIVGISSISSLIGEPGTSAYSMTKAAMNAMIRSLSTELLKRRIRINAILPGIVASKMGCDLDDRTEEDYKKIEEHQPMGVIPTEDVAEMVNYLLSEKARYMTGELITISGGYRG